MPIDVLNELSLGWTKAIWPAFWQGGLAIAIVLVICRAFRKIPAHIQCWLWRLAFIKLLIAGWISPIELCWLEHNTVVAAARSPGIWPIESSVATQPELRQHAPEQVPLQTAADRSSLTLWSCLFLVWLLGVLASVSNLIRRCVRIRKLRLQLDACDEADIQDRLTMLGRRLRLRRVPEVRISRDANGPFLLGFFAPTIVIPCDVLSSSAADELDALFAHELAHIKRRDLAWNWLPSLVETLYFFHPAVWLAKREWRLAQEIATDQLAIRGSQLNVTRYSRSLLSIIEKCPNRQVRSQFVVSVSETYAQLKRRIIAMRDFQDISVTWRFVHAASVLAIAFVGVLPWKLIAQTPGIPESDKAVNDRSVRTGIDEAAATNTQRTITVHVVDDSNGRPLEGVKIFRNHIYKGRGLRPTEIENETFRTDATGTAVVSLADDSVDLRLWARRANYAPLYARWAKGAQRDGHLIPAEFTFRLQQGTEIGGVITNEDAEPIAGAKIEVMDDTARHSTTTSKDGRGIRPVRAYMLANGDDVVTDANGRWRLGNVPADRELVFDPELRLRDEPTKILLKLSHPDFESDFEFGGIQREQNVPFASLRDQTATLAMKRGNSIDGVVSSPNGRPISNALVVLCDAEHSRGYERHVMTDENGRYRFDHLRPRPMSVLVMADGWAPEVQRFDVAESVEPISIGLKRATRQQVQFVDSEGKPVPDVVVYILRWREAYWVDVQFATGLPVRLPHVSDKNGIVDFTLAENDQMICSFSKLGYVPRQDFTVEAADGKYTVKLERATP